MPDIAFVAVEQGSDLVECQALLVFEIGNKGCEGTLGLGEHRNWNIDRWNLEDGKEVMFLDAGSVHQFACCNSILPLLKECCKNPRPSKREGFLSFFAVKNAFQQCTCYVGITWQK